MPTAATPVRERRLVSIDVAAAHYDINPRTLRRRISDGTITGYRVAGHLIKVDIVECDERLVRPIPAGGGHAA